MSSPTRTAPASTPDAPAPPAGRQEVIAVRDLRHRYGDREALRGISFGVRSGEIFGFLGPNGGGKSTLFRILSTMIPPTSGSVLLLGSDAVADPDRVRRELGVVFQSPGLDRMLTVRENLVHQGHLYGLRGRELRGRAEELTGILGIADRLGDRTEDLSGGMRRRVEVAKALLHHPKLLLMDEPTTGLDPAARLDLWDHLRRLRNTRRVTIVFTTHLMDEAEGCDRLAILDRGNLVALDAPPALKETVHGEVVTVECADPEAMVEELRRGMDLDASVVAGRVRLELDSGADAAKAILHRFPDVRSVAVGKPTLEDVFIDLTGHRFETDSPATGDGGRRRRGRRR